MPLKSRPRPISVTCLLVFALPALALVGLTAWQMRSASRPGALFTAIRRNDAAAVTALLNAAAVTALLNAGADPNGRDPDTARGLTQADHFFAAFNHDNRRENGQTPLLAALCRIRTPRPNTTVISVNPESNPTIIRALLDKGADVNATDDNGMTTPLLFAVQSSNTEIVEMLIQRGEKVNELSQMGTPLICAACQGRTDMMRFLLARGADVNAQDVTGGTALITTIRYARSPDCVRLLLDHDADPNRKDKVGNTALTVAQKPFLGLPRSQAQYLPQIVEMLKKVGAK